MDCKITAHSLGHKMLSAVFLHHLRIHFGRDFSRQGKNESSGKLRVPLIFNGFYCVPERCPVCISGRRIGWQHDLSVDKLFLLVVEFRFLVVFAEQPFAALVGCASNSGLPLAAFYDGDFEMRTRNRHHPQTKRPPSKIVLVERSEIVFGFARRLDAECCALRGKAGSAKG